MHMSLCVFVCVSYSHQNRTANNRLVCTNGMECVCVMRVCAFVFARSRVPVHGTRPSINNKRLLFQIRAYYACSQNTPSRQPLLSAALLKQKQTPHTKHMYMVYYTRPLCNPSSNCGSRRALCASSVLRIVCTYMFVHGAYQTRELCVVQQTNLTANAHDQSAFRSFVHSLTIKRTQTHTATYTYISLCVSVCIIYSFYLFCLMTWCLIRHRQWAAAATAHTKNYINA